MLRKFVISASAVALCASMAAPVATAQGISWVADSRTEFTFNTPVEMPGITLPPGTYIFRLADHSTSRKVMQVIAKDASNKNYGLFMTIEAQRPQASREAELRFMETPAGTPTAVRTWWYPGNTYGREFIYPKSQARRLAQATNTTVLTTKAESATTDQLQTADLAQVTPTGQETAVSGDVAAAVITPADSSAASASASTATGSQDRGPVNMGQSAANTAGRTRLPRTSTVMPLVGLIGLASLLGGALRFRR
jgi:hypothetical protein